MARNSYNGTKRKVKAMAPLPPNNTPRIVLSYVDNSTNPVAHDVQFRVSAGDPDGVQVQTAFLAMLTALGPNTFYGGWRVLGCSRQAEGSEFSMAVPLISGIASFAGTSAGYGRAFAPREVTFQGKSPTTGRRVDFSLFGTTLAINNSFRYTLSNLPVAWQNALNGLNAADQPFKTIDGSKPTWYPYVNISNNSYWERRLRAS